MPIYEYCCPQCKLRFELFRPASESDETARCPQCHDDAERVFSTFASFSKNTQGVSSPTAGSSTCGTCSATSCSTCRH